MDKMKLFSVVEFPEGLQLVPSSWLTKDQSECYIPPYTTPRRVEKATKCFEVPDQNWKLYPVQRIFSSSNSYKRGVEKCKAAEYESEGFLSTEYESSQKDPDDPDHSFIEYPVAPPSLLNANNQVHEDDSICESPNFAGRNDENMNSCIERQKKDTRGVETLFRQMANLKYSVNEILTNQELMIKKINQLTAKTDEGERVLNITLPKLPLSTDEELGQLEDQLNDQNFRKALISDLSKIGGHHLNEIVRRIMSYMLTDELASGFSCYGMKKKKSFALLKTFDVLAEAVRLQLPTITNKEVVKPLSSWLRHARERVEKQNFEKCT